MLVIMNISPFLACNTIGVSGRRHQALLRYDYLAWPVHINMFARKTVIFFFQLGFFFLFFLVFLFFSGSALHLLLPPLLLQGIRWNGYVPYL